MRGAFALSVGLLACTIPELDFTGKGCEDGFCPAGYVCNESARCVRGEGAAGPGGGSSLGAGGGHGLGGSTGQAGGATTYEDVVLADAPLAYYRLGETFATDPAVDRTGGGRDANYTFASGAGNVTLGVPGAIANSGDTAVTLEGLSEVSLPASTDFMFAPDHPFTFEAWVRMPAGGADPQRLLVRCLAPDPEPEGGGWKVFLQVEAFHAKLYGLDATRAPAYEDTPDQALTGEAFRHLVIVFGPPIEAGKTYAVSIYVDGEVTLVNHHLGIELIDQPAPLELGVSENRVAPPITLDEIAIYDHTLGGSRIALHHRCGRSGACE
jgi:hypothetical protein